jgi:hypothetical protein
MAHSFNNGEVKINLGLKAAMGDSRYRRLSFDQGKKNEIQQELERAS